jgi:hypothetical protein
LREGKDSFSVDLSLSSNDSITMVLGLFHSEVGTSVCHISIVLLESATIKQELNSLSSSKLVVSVLLVDSLLTSSEMNFLINVFPPLLEGLSPNACAKALSLHV